MSFKPLTDKRRNLLSVGYDGSKRELASSCYDLLASEARIATFIAVAKGDAPQEAWFRLGRQHTVSEGESVPVSWTGTMFAYGFRRRIGSRLLDRHDVRIPDAGD